jgi:ribonuclease BN (tRNA processing enzyme)
MHVTDVAALAPALRNRHLVLTHLSRRHRVAPAVRTIRKQLGAELQPALHFLNVEWD